MKVFLPQKAPSFDTLQCFPFSLQTTWDAVLLFPCRYEDLLIARILIIITSKISTVGSVLQETCAKQINPRQKEKLLIDMENKSSFQVSITITKIMEFQRKKKKLETQILSCILSNCVSNDPRKDLDPGPVHR